MRRRILVTGAAGFVGRKLCAHLAQGGYQVLATDHASSTDFATYRGCDFSRPDDIADMMEWAGDVDGIFHLAAITFVPDAAADPDGVMRVNLEGTQYLVQAMRRSSPASRLIFVSSSEIYGAPQSLPVDETHPLNPNNPYAISKAAADDYCRHACETWGLDIVRMRPFNHSGPGQSDKFVLSSFARQVAEIEAGRGEPIMRVGNLDVARDFSHVDDIVRAYGLALEKGVSGAAYNLCSGQAHSVREALDYLIAQIDVDAAVEPDPARMRTVDIPEVRGSYAAFHADTGWEPEISFAQLLNDLLAYWRNHA
jgi:GDP-4-dehydro-6-deoxy-D-mannose reductase